MKKSIVIITVCYFVMSFGAFAQLKVLSNGYVSIGTFTGTQYDKLYVDGRARFITGNFNGTTQGIIIGSYYTDGIIDPLYDGSGTLGCTNKWGQAFINRITTAFPITISDEKIKENIRPITNALQIISQLNSVQYDLKKEYFDGKDEPGKANISSNLPIKNRIGFIAQEVKNVLPEIVVYDSIQKIHGIIYENLIPVLSQAINEQQAEIKELKEKLDQIEGNSNELKSASMVETIKARLDQNMPNPFSNETRIDCIIPEGSGSSVLYIYNMNGTQLQQYSINGKREQSVTISGNTLEAGMYIYALVIDGREIDTKRMILTK